MHVVHSFLYTNIRFLLCVLSRKFESKENRRLGHADLFILQSLAEIGNLFTVAVSICLYSNTITSRLKQKPYFKASVSCIKIQRSSYSHKASGNFKTSQVPTGANDVCSVTNCYLKN